MYHFKAFGYSVGVVIHGPAILLKKRTLMILTFSFS